MNIYLLISNYFADNSTDLQCDWTVCLAIFGGVAVLVLVTAFHDWHEEKHLQTQIQHEHQFHVISGGKDSPVNNGMYTMTVFYI